MNKQIPLRILCAHIKVGDTVIVTHKLTTEENIELAEGRPITCWDSCMDNCIGYIFEVTHIIYDYVNPICVKLIDHRGRPTNYMNDWAWPPQVFAKCSITKDLS